MERKKKVETTGFLYHIYDVECRVYIKYQTSYRLLIYRSEINDKNTERKEDLNNNKKRCFFEVHCTCFVPLTQDTNSLSTPITWSLSQSVD